MIFPVLILQSLTSFFLCSLFNLGIIFFLSYFALIVLNIEILSLFKGITGINILILTLIETLITGVIWFLKGKRGLKFALLRGGAENFVKTIKSDKLLLILSLALMFTLFVSFFLILVSPPNEADASSYHCLRSLFWAKDGFISHFETADVRCHSMPVNSELFYTWILSLTKNDTGFGFLQFFSYFVLIISSFNIMKIFNIDFNKRIWAILIFSSFAGVISQISSTQTDLTTGALIVCSLYLVLKYKEKPSNTLLYFASLSMSLSFGVKSTGVMGSIPLLIWFLFILKKDFIKYFSFLILNFFIFSSYNYILNFINYGNFLGARSAINEHSLYWTNFETFIKGGTANLIRYSFSIFDFSNLPPFYLLTPVYDNIVHFVFNLVNINPLFNSNGEIPHLNATLSEQVTGFGILSFSVLLPSSILALFNKKLRSFVLIFIFQTLILSFSIIYFPTTIRFFVSFSAFLIPVLTITYKTRKFKMFIFLVAFFYLITTPLFLVQRPFLKIFNEFKLNTDIKRLTDNIRDVRYKFYFMSKNHIFLKDGINEICDKNSIAVYLSDGFMAYPVKYLDFKNQCNIDFLTFDKENDLTKYDYIVFEGGFQEISAVKDFVPGKNCKITNYMERPTGKFCKITASDFSLTHIPYKEINYKADDFLHKTGNDNDTTFYILKKL